jgi:hypothetical protein
MFFKNFGEVSELLAWQKGPGIIFQALLIDTANISHILFF